MSLRTVAFFVGLGIACGVLGELTSCLCHVPRGPQRCAGAPTKACVGGTPFVDDPDGGTP